jgi:hypothetical protein
MQHHQLVLSGLETPSTRWPKGHLVGHSNKSHACSGKLSAPSSSLHFFAYPTVCFMGDGPCFKDVIDFSHAPESTMLYSTDKEKQMVLYHIHCQIWTKST